MSGDPADWLPTLSAAPERPAHPLVEWVADLASVSVTVSIAGLVVVVGAVAPVAVGLIAYRLVSRTVARWVG